MENPSVVTRKLSPILPRTRPSPGSGPVVLHGGLRPQLTSEPPGSPTVIHRLLGTIQEAWASAEVRGEEGEVIITEEVQTGAVVTGSGRWTVDCWVRL